MDNVKRRKIIIISGPTASGKSSLAIKLARKIGGEIISSDSRQVYRKMNIGTGKVTEAEQRLARHHLLNVVSPEKQFGADDFKKLGRTAIEDILSRNKVPIVCGGTGFFTDVLVFDFPIPDVPPDAELRKKLEKKSAGQLFTRLKKLDPRRAATIDRNNPRRLIRALEIVISTGKPAPQLSTDYTKRKSPYEILWLGINPGKEELNGKIEKRLDERLKKGLLKEVGNLHASGISWKRLESFGLEYRWIAKFLQNKINRREMRDGLLKDIIGYSKRQMTWLRRNKKIRWMRSDKIAMALTRKFLS